MTDDPEVAALAAEYPEWRIHRHRDSDALIAWLPGLQPPFRLRAVTVARLREQLLEAERVHAARAARAADEDGGTGSGQSTG